MSSIDDFTPFINLSKRTELLEACGWSEDRFDKVITSCFLAIESIRLTGLDPKNMDEFKESLELFMEAHADTEEIRVLLKLIEEDARENYLLLGDQNES